MFNKMLIFLDSASFLRVSFLSQLPLLRNDPQHAALLRRYHQSLGALGDWGANGGRKNKSKSWKEHKEVRWVASLSSTAVFFQALGKLGIVIVWYIYIQLLPQASKQSGAWFQIQPGEYQISLWLISDLPQKQRNLTDLQGVCVNSFLLCSLFQKDKAFYQMLTRFRVENLQLFTQQGCSHC